jgi:hypothetical protein
MADSAKSGSGFGCGCPPLVVTDLRKLPAADAKRKAGKAPVSEESEAPPVAISAPPVWAGTVGLFESACLSGSGQSGASADGQWEQAVAFCGGPIWGLDWLGDATIFQEEGQAEDHQIVAVASMAAEHHEVVCGAPVQGETFVQVDALTMKSFRAPLERARSSTRACELADLEHGKDGGQREGSARNTDRARAHPHRIRGSL